jgi:hypothetical protein
MHSLQGRTIPRLPTSSQASSFPAHEGALAGYYDFAMYLFTICGARKFFVHSAEVVYDMSLLLLKLYLKWPSIEQYLP